MSKRPSPVKIAANEDWEEVKKRLKREAEYQRINSLAIREFGAAKWFESTIKCEEES